MTDILSWGAEVGRNVAALVAADDKVSDAALQSVNRVGDEAVEIVLRVEREAPKALQETTGPSV